MKIGDGIHANMFSLGDVTGDVSLRTADYGLADSHRSASGENMPVLAQSLPSIDEKALLRKIDFRVIPILFIIYVAAFLDR